MLALDVCRCVDNLCPDRLKCARYTDIPANKRLSFYATFREGNKKCAFLIPNEEEKKDE